MCEKIMCICCINLASGYRTCLVEIHIEITLALSEKYVDAQPFTSEGK